MTVAHETDTRNAIAETVGTRHNGGSIVIQEGAIALVTFPLQDPAFGAPSNGTTALQGTPIQVQGSADGTADSFTSRDSADNAEITGTVTAVGGGGDIEIDNTAIAVDQNVDLTELTYTAPT